MNTKWLSAGRETDSRLNQTRPEQARNYPESLALIKVEPSSMDDVETLLQEYEENLTFERKV